MKVIIFHYTPLTKKTWIYPLYFVHSLWIFLIGCSGAARTSCLNLKGCSGAARTSCLNLKRCVLKHVQFSSFFVERRQPTSRDISSPGARLIFSWWRASLLSGLGIISIARSTSALFTKNSFTDVFVSRRALSKLLCVADITALSHQSVLFNVPPTPPGATFPWPDSKEVHVPALNPRLCNYCCEKQEVASLLILCARTISKKRAIQTLVDVCPEGSPALDGGVSI